MSSFGVSSVSSANPHARRARTSSADGGGGSDALFVSVSDPVALQILFLFVQTFFLTDVIFTYLESFYWAFGTVGGDLFWQLPIYTIFPLSTSWLFVWAAEVPCCCCFRCGCCYVKKAVKDAGVWGWGEVYGRAGGVSPYMTGGGPVVVGPAVVGAAREGGHNKNNAAQHVGRDEKDEEPELPSGRELQPAGEGTGDGGGLTRKEAEERQADADHGEIMGNDVDNDIILVDRGPDEDAGNWCRRNFHFFAHDRKDQQGACCCNYFCFEPCMRWLAGAVLAEKSEDRNRRNSNLKAVLALVVGIPLVNVSQFHRPVALLVSFLIMLVLYVVFLPGWAFSSGGRRHQFVGGVGAPRVGEFSSQGEGGGAGPLNKSSERQDSLFSYVPTKHFRVRFPLEDFAVLILLAPGGVLAYSAGKVANGSLNFMHTLGFTAMLGMLSGK